MSDTPQSPSTALMIPETGAAIGRIVEDVIGVAARLLPDRRGKRPLSEGARRRIIEEHVLRSPSNPTAPFVAQVSFGGEMRRVGSTTSETAANGEQFIDDEGNATLGFVPDYDVAILGKAELPDPKDPSRRVSCDVQPLVLCDGRGGLVPYVIPEEERVRAGKPMYCLFICDFDMKSGQENGRVLAVPLGLADPANIVRYHEVNTRFTVQGSSKAGQEIEAIPNNLGRAVQFLELEPPGSPATQGLLPVWKNWSFDELDPRHPDYWIVERLLGGKVATKHSKSQPVIIRDGAVPSQIFRVVREGWNSVELLVWGLPDEIVSMELRELEQTAYNVDWLTLFGASLYTVTPWSGTTLVRQGLQRPPLDEMIAVGLLPPGSSEELARQTVRGQRAKILADVERVVTQALNDLVHNLGTGGRENPGLSLADVLGGEPSGELLALAHDKAPTQDNLLLVALIASNTAGELGLEVWDPKCWVLEKAYKALLLEMAKQHGIELPPPPAQEQADETASTPAESTDSGAASPTNGSAASATIAWHEGMKRDELYELAKTLKGVTSKAIKATLVEALTAVCPPTTPA